MKRSILLVLPVLVVAACGATAGGDVAATVGDTRLTVSDVEGLPYTASGTMEVAEFAQYLGALIQWQILDDAAAEDFSIDPSEEEVTAELDTVLATQAGGVPLAEFAESQNFSEDTVRRIVRVGLIQQLVAEELGAEAPEPSDEEVAEALVDRQAGLTEVCARHILVGTAEEAAEAKDRLEGGEDFAAVAGEVSVDPSAADNGGDLGCAPAERYVPEFAEATTTAEIDSITDPVESEFGFHVIQVYERTEPAPEDLPTEDEVRDSLAGSVGAEALQDWLLEKIDQADVAVEEEYGTWVTEPQPMVQPPAN